MSWLLFAFSGPVLWAISTHFDKYLVERYFKRSDVAVLMLFTAMIGVVMLPPITLFAPNVMAPPARDIALIAGSGILYMGAMLLYLQALQGEEASVVAPFFQIGPLFGYGLAYLVLGETLSGRQMAGGALVLGGAALVSIRFGVARPAFKLRLVLLMLSCGLAMAIAALIFKVFAIAVEFWTTTFWMFVGEALFGVAILAVPSYRAQFVAVLRRNPVALLAINGSNELINLGGSLGNRFALTLAPLSLVQAIGSTTTLFVFGFGVVLSLIAPPLAREALSASDLLQKGIAALAVAAGIALISG
jgi:uncharacterized membrane protein